MRYFLSTHPLMPRRSYRALVMLLLAACAPQRPAPGALAPVSARTTNQAAAADLAAIDAWEAHRVALLRNDGTDLPSRGIALARAGAWIAFAREAYVARPHTSDADDALLEARRLMAPFEKDAATGAGRSSLATAADRLSPDNWAEVDRLASRPGAVQDVALLAEAEIELVRATTAHTIMTTPGVMLAGAPSGAVPSAVELPSEISSSSVSAASCVAGRHIARAVQLLGEADVVQAEQARQLATVARLQEDERIRARSVHFALASDELGMPSAALLNGVTDALRAHPELQIVIEGHSDPRGTDMNNLELSGRRANTVRDILAEDGVAEERMLVRQFGATKRRGAGRTPADYALDRRVQLKFVLPDGEELPIVEDAAVDLQIERVLARKIAARPKKASHSKVSP
jgi:outer membrane protein OmpA-like peptidoglycan-associated protein